MSEGERERGSDCVCLKLHVSGFIVFKELQSLWLPNVNIDFHLTGPPSTFSVF